MPDAAKLFEAFHGYPPAAGQLPYIQQDRAEQTLEIGSVYGIMYKVPEVPEPYLHKFNARSRPRLFVSANGRQIYILNGVYRFTDRGFIG